MLESPQIGRIDQKGPAVAAACLFASGFAGLVYELCWIRQAALSLGSTTYAVSTVLAVFFGGMALGSWQAGKRADDVRQPMRAYAILEALLAVMALTSGLAFELVDLAYGVVYAAVEHSAQRSSMLLAARVLLLSLVLLPPATLMGATLPLCCRQLVRARVSASVAGFYALNTLGAVAGCFVAGLWWIPTLGISTSLRLGVVANVAAAVGAWLMRWPAPLRRDPARARATPPRRQRRIGVLFFLSGFAIVGGEVVWTRFLSLLVEQTAYSYTIAIGVILAGIVIGAALAGRLSERLSPALSFGALQIFTALYAITALSLPPDTWRAAGVLDHGALQQGLVHVVLLLPPAITSGASFPIAVRMVVRHPVDAGAGVGRMAAINTFGGILGSLSVGFLALPAWGLARSLHLTTAASLLAGISAWIWLGRFGWWRLAGALIALAAWLSLPHAWGTRLPADFLASPAALVDYQEGRAANVAVLRHGDVLELHIDRLWQGQSGKNHQIMAAHVPMLLHPDPRRVLVIGVGAGLGPSRFMLYEPEALDCVDVEPAVFDMVARHFDAAWMRDPRVRLLEEDGRNHLMHTAERYDVVSIEVGQLFRPGVGAFYTRELYAAAHQRLHPGGIVSQFVPISFLSLAQLESLVRTFVDVFPASVLWYNTSELLLLGFRDAIHPPRLALLDDGPIHDDLHYAHWGGPRYALHQRHVFLGGLLLGPAGLEAVSQGGVVLRDDHPLIDQWQKNAAERAIIAALRSERQPATQVLGVSEADADAIERIQSINLADLEVSSLLRGVSLEHASPETNLRLLSEAVALNPRNSRVHALLGQLYLGTGDVDAAVAHLRAAVAIDGQDVSAQRSYAYARHRAGDVDGAIDGYRWVLARRPDDAETHNNIGVALAERGQLEEAASHFAEALRLRPDYADAARNLERARMVFDAPVP